MKKLPVFLIALLLGVSSLAQSTDSKAVSSGQTPLDALSFLIGQWSAEGGGTPGGSAGEFSFTRAADGRALIRINESATPGGRHSDVMLVYVASDGQPRALYTDNEGHTIEYGLTIDKEGRRVILESSGPGPRFRLWYKQNEDHSLATGFEIAQPGSTEFKSYLEGVAHRK